MTDLDASSGADVSGYAEVEQSISTIVTTAQGERVMREWFGNPGTRLLGESATSAVILKWFTILWALLDVNEPRFKVDQFQVNSVGRSGLAVFTMNGTYYPYALQGFVQSKVFVSVNGNEVSVRSAA